MLFGFAARMCVRWRGRQEYRQGGSFYGPAANGNEPCTLLHDPVDGRKPQPGPFSRGFCRKEGIDGVGLDLLAHAGSDLGDCRQNSTPGQLRRVWSSMNLGRFSGSGTYKTYKTGFRWFCRYGGRD